MKYLNPELEKLEQRIAPDCVSVLGITVCNDDGSGDGSEGSEGSEDDD